MLQHWSHMHTPLGDCLSSYTLCMRRISSRRPGDDAPVPFRRDPRLYQQRPEPTAYRPAEPGRAPRSTVLGPSPIHWCENTQYVSPLTKMDGAEENCRSKRGGGWETILQHHVPCVDCFQVRKSVHSWWPPPRRVSRCGLQFLVVVDEIVKSCKVPRVGIGKAVTLCVLALVNHSASPSATHRVCVRRAVD